MELSLVLQLLEEERLKFNIKRETKNEYLEIPIDDDKACLEKINKDGNIHATNNSIFQPKKFAIPPNNESSIKHLNGENLKTFSCEICSKVYGSSDTLSHHRSFHKGDTKCEHCGKVYSTKRNLKIHVQSMHLKEFSLKCLVCDYTTNRADSLLKHKRIHTGEKPYICEMCEFCCSDPSSLNAHRKTHKNANGRNSNKILTIICSLCKKVFSTMKLLAKHKNEQHAKVSHELQTKFCDICNKNFSSNQSLKHHTIVTHTKEYPEMCDGCGQGFTATGLGTSLKKHKEACGSRKDQL